MKRHYLILLTIVMAGAVTVMGEKKVRAKPDKMITYKKIGDVELKLHVFYPEGWKEKGDKPCIVFFFGGGWMGGTPSQFYEHSRYLASRGMVAISAEYRTKNGHGVEPYACVSDAKSAVRWIRQHADELGIDPDKLAAGGGSAGGHLAAATGSLKGFDEPDEDKSVSSRPNALVLFNPVYDNGPGGYGYDRVKDRWQEFSPMHNISSNTPPTIVFFGTKDKHASSGTARKYKKKMEDAGVRSELWLYEGQPHGFFNFRDGNNPCYYSTVYQSDKFLASLGYLAGEPTIEDKTREARGTRQ